MRTFAELLTTYTLRTGVTDAELARAVGVQRQTIFRWKEGLVARPRSAEDVLHCASKLRLTPEERDELLLAAGFPPAGHGQESNANQNEVAGPGSVLAAPSRLPLNEAITTAMPVSAAPLPRRVAGRPESVWPDDPRPTAPRAITPIVR